MSAATDCPTEILPDRPPFLVFFFPNLWAVLLAWMMERVGLEGFLHNYNPAAAAHHRYALLGLACFALANVHSYLSGCVVCARNDYNVKLPNLYANYKDSDNNSSSSAQSKADAIQFNCIQRGHQNFVENLPLMILSTGLLVLLERPNVAGLMVLIVAVARILYALGYRKNIRARFPYFLISQFAGLVGVGYGALAAVSYFNIGPFAQIEKPAS